MSPVAADVMSLLEQFNTTPGTWYAVIDLPYAFSLSICL